MSIADLQEDLLYMIVFGPGIGESVVLRVPPDKWIVIDGCRDGSIVPAVETLAANRGVWDCIILTHPHADHAEGLDAVLSINGAGPVGCAVPVAPELDDMESLEDPIQVSRLSAVEQVLAKIDDLWSQNPESQWEIRRRDEKRIGECRITALHPDDATVASAQRDPNSLSTPVLLEWKDVKLVLGADLPKREWDELGDVFPHLSHHTGTKIPHHGSKGSISTVVCGTDRAAGRFWVLTPFSRQRLPRYDDGEGLAIMLQHVDEVHFTALPQKRNLHGNVPFTTTRRNLKNGRSPESETAELGAGTVAVPSRIPPGEIACYVVAGFDASGVLQDLRHGPGSVVVKE